MQYTTIVVEYGDPGDYWKREIVCDDILYSHNLSNKDALVEMRISGKYACYDIINPSIL